MLAKTNIEDILYDKGTVLEFLASKDPNERYNYHQANSCAFAQFLQLHGTDPDEFYTKVRDCVPSGIWDDILNPGDGSVAWTYGQALARAHDLFSS